MNNKTRENAGFYAVGLTTVVIAVLGVTANLLYQKTGGYGLGAGLSIISMICGFFVFAIAPDIAKTRTKGNVACSLILTFIHSILFIVGDLANVNAYNYEYRDGNFVAVTTGLGKFAFAFGILCIIYLVLSTLRLTLNLFGKEIKFYERTLGTYVVRYKDRNEITLDLPEKDTDKLVTNAKKALSSNQKLINALQDSEIVPDQDVATDTPVSKDKIEQEPPKEKIERVRTEATENIVRNETEESEDLPTDDVSSENTADASPTESEFFVDNPPNESEVDFDNSVDQTSTDIVSETDAFSDDDSDDDDNSVPNEIYADADDVGGVSSEYDTKDDFRNTSFVHRITDRVENDDDDIYDDFDYDDNDDSD